LNPYDVGVGDESEVWYSDENGNAPGAWFPTLRMTVATGGDWINVGTAPLQPFAIAVRAPGGGLKATLTGVTDRSGEMRGWEGHWQDKWVPARPQILPGDVVRVEAYGYVKEMRPVGEIKWQADAGADRITGQIRAPGQTEPVQASCGVWEDPGITLEARPKWVEPDGRTFTCDFRAAGYDLKTGQYVGVCYKNANSDDTCHSAPVQGGSKVYLPLLRR
jgi:hypothetical protein